MKLAFSNIAWRVEEEAQAIEILKAEGFEGVEIAPPKISSTPHLLTEEEVSNYRRKFEDAGLQIVATQALLFGKPDLVLFGTEEAREALLEHLKKMIDVTAWLGGKTLVFGSPKNRLKGNLTEAQTLEIAKPFFSALGNYAQSKNCVFCIEPNPDFYGCDYILRTEEAIALVDAIDNQGFGWHNDGATLVHYEMDLAYIQERIKDIHHFHISVPFLEPIDSKPELEAGHISLLKALKAADYKGFVSIEMRDSASPNSNLEQVQRCAQYLKGLIAGL